MDTVIQRKLLTPFLAAAPILLVAAQIFGAEPVKLRHVASVYSDERGMGLKNPEGIASRQSSGFIVADSGNGRLLRYTLDERTVGAAVEEIRIPQLTYPTRVDMNSKDEIFVLDGSKRLLFVLNPDGTFKSEIRPTGVGVPSSSVFRSFHIDADDRIYLLDVHSERVWILGADEKVRKHIRFPEEYGFFSDLTVHGGDTILLIDSVTATVYSAQGEASRLAPLTESMKNYMRFPTSIATDDRGRIYLLDRNGSSVVILSQHGSFLSRYSALGWKDGLLNLPSQLCMTNEGVIFIADSNNNRVQIFETVE